MVTSFEEAVTYINSFIPKSTDVRFAGQFGLDRQRHLLMLLGNPQDTFPCVHITGTSGKSSTSYLISRLLKEAGYRVGLHISPHLVSPCERIQINNEQISEDEFVKTLNTVIPHIEQMRSDPFGSPSYFEILVAMTYLLFSKRKVDIAVIEVGLGGRFDGTNVITKTLVSVITNVGLDHTHVLGDTVEKIIDDKKEIIKPGCSVVSAAAQESVKAIIKTKCHEGNVPLSFLGEEAKVTDVIETDHGTQFDFSFKKLRFTRIIVGLLGEHQAKNAALAIMAVYELQTKGFHVDEEHIRKALQHAYFNGRLDIVRKKPLVVLDGAHNEDKIKALVHAFPACFSYSSCTIILALKSDKDSEKILPLVCSLGDSIVLTKFSKETDMGTSLSKSPSELVAIIAHIDPKKKVRVYENPIAAVNDVIRKQDPKTAVLITGSLYLVGEVKRAIIEKMILL